jgi:hypothetical protein
MTQIHLTRVSLLGFSQNPWRAPPASFTQESP